MKRGLTDCEKFITDVKLLMFLSFVFLFAYLYFTAGPFLTRTPASQETA
jgi:hypothetical protein